MPVELLPKEDRDIITGIYTQLAADYKTLERAIAKGEPTGEIKLKIEKIDESLTEFHSKHQKSIDRLDRIEEKLNQKRAEAPQPKSFGERLMEDPGLLAFLKSGANGAYTATLKGWRADQKAITGIGALIPQAQPGIAVGPRLPIGVRELVPQGSTTAGAISYLRETAFTNAAAVVAEGAAKPYSDKTFAAVIAPITTIATLFKVSKQSYEDVPGLGAQIESNGIYGVQKAEDNQLLNGSGVAPQLQGFMTVAAAAPAAAAPLTVIDAIGLAVFDLAAKGYMPDGVVANPADWGAVALLKNSQGNYLFANPIDYTVAPRIWGARMVLTSSMAIGSFLVGAFKGNSLILDREEVNAQVAEQNVDDFEKNMLTVRVEERLALLIYNATAFEKGVKPAAMAGGTPPPAEGAEEESRRRRG
jgi:HK97 family phage major capsid protein